MQLRILGSGDAFSSGGRLPSCYLVENGPSRFMVECSPAVLTGLHRAGLSSDGVSTIFISHLHGDHFGGLPFVLIDAMFPRRRTKPLTLAGPLGLEHRFRLACEVFYPRVAAAPLAFELRFVELEKGIVREVDGITVTPFEVDHYAGSQSLALRFEVGGKTLAFSGDTGWTPAVIEAGKGADLYLLECNQYDLQLSMHLDYLTIERHHNIIGARQTVLTHMGDTMLASQHLVDATRYGLADDGKVFEF